MQYNTALGFVALALGAIGVLRNSRPLMFFGGVVAFVLGAAVIGEYVEGMALGVDTWFFTPWSQDLTPEAGRMALPTAFCFSMSGAPLLFLAFRRSYSVLGIMNSVTLSVGMTSLVGYAFGATYLVSYAYGTSMALHTALAFFLYSTALLGYSWTRDGHKSKGSPIWMPELSVALLPVMFYAAETVIPEDFASATLWSVSAALIVSSSFGYAVGKLLTVSVTMKGTLMVAMPSLLLVMFAGLIANVDHDNELNQASTFQSALVTETSQHLFSTVILAESSVRSFMLTHDPASIDAFPALARTSKLLAAEESRLVATNPPQLRRAARIDALVQKRMEALATVIGIVRSSDQAAIAKVITDRAGPLRGELVDELDTFSSEEARFGAARTAALARSWEKINKLLVSGASAALLLASLFAAAFSGGMTRRIKTMQENIGRFDQGRKLLPMIGGRDEIAHLDEVFHEMAQTLDQVHHDEEVLRLQADIRTAELERFRSAMDGSAEAIILTDPVSSLIVEANSTTLRMTGYGRDDLMQKSISSLTGTVDSEDLQIMLRAAALPAGVETSILTKDGATLDVELHIQHARVAEGWVDVNVIRNITENKEARRRLHQLAHFDALTALPNRVLFFQNLERVLMQAKEQKVGVLVLSIGLDGFKFVNEARGHAIGDRVLQLSADRVISAIRMRDGAARLGSDEIAVVMVMDVEEMGPTTAANKLLESIRQPYEIDGEQSFITASIGLSVFPNDALDAEALLRHAQAAMHRAKDAGRDTFRFYTAQMNVEARARGDLLAALKLAIDREEFVLHFQPKARVSSNKISGVEALLRWERPGHGLVSPAVFIPILEDTSLIIPVGAWVIRQACKQIAAWDASDIGPIQIAVNVAIRQFEGGNLTKEVTSALRETGISPALLELELTESSLMANTEQTVASLRSLRALGVRISIDDFGTGFSSLAYLRRFPIDRLKIDIAFIREITTNPDDAAIAVAIIHMAHSLKLDVVAEGVESESQLSYLRRHLCDYYQGYYFSRPLALEALEAFLRRDAALVQDESSVTTWDTILLIDDEPEQNDALASILEREGYRVLCAESADKGFDILALHDVQVIISDQRMPGTSGVEFFDRVKDLHPHTFRIILSGFTDSESILESINRGAISHFHTKPVNVNLLLSHLRKTFRHYWLLRDERVVKDAAA